MREGRHETNDITMFALHKPVNQAQCLTNVCVYFQPFGVVYWAVLNYSGVSKKKISLHSYIKCTEKLFKTIFNWVLSVGDVCKIVFRYVIGEQIYMFVWTNYSVVSQLILTLLTLWSVSHLPWHLTPCDQHSSTLVSGHQCTPAPLGHHTSDETRESESTLRSVRHRNKEKWYLKRCVSWQRWQHHC